MVKGAMTYEEFRRQLGKAGLTNKAFAELVKINPNSITNYKKDGEVPAHWAIVVLLMGVMAEHKLDFKDALIGIEIEAKKARGRAAKGRFGGSRQAEFPV